MTQVPESHDHEMSLFFALIEPGEEQRLKRINTKIPKLCQTALKKCRKYRLG